MSFVINFFVELFWWIVVEIILNGIGNLLKQAYRFLFPLPAKPLPKKRKIRFELKR